MVSLDERIQNLSIQFVPFILAVVCHEFGHGFMASRFGDRTAQEAGRLTLNPVPHIDPVGTLLFPLINMATGMNILFGWAKPVPIDPRRFSKFRPGLFFVSLAGPGMNFLLAFLSAAAACALLMWVPDTFYLHTPLIKMATISIPLNYALGIFNLIPLPPLDGSKMVESVLPLKLAARYESLARFGFFILWALLLSGALSYLSYPISLFSNVTFNLVAKAFGLPDAVALP